MKKKKENNKTAYTIFYKSGTKYLRWELMDGTETAPTVEKLLAGLNPDDNIDDLIVAKIDFIGTIKAHPEPFIYLPYAK
jgi:hypothetical protein